MYSQEHPYITYFAPRLRAPQELSLEAAIRHLQGDEPPLVIEHNGDFAAGGHYDAWVRKRNDKKKAELKSRMCSHAYAHAARLAEAAARPTPPPQQAPQQQAAKRTRMKSKRRSKSPGAGNHEKNKEPQKHCRRRGR